MAFQLLMKLCVSRLIEQQFAYLTSIGLVVDLWISELLLKSLLYFGCLGDLFFDPIKTVA